MEGIKDTEYDFALVLRQRYTEDILREKLDSVGVPHSQATECIDYEIDEGAPLDSHGVTSTFEDKRAGGTFALRRYSCCFKVRQKLTDAAIVNTSLAPMAPAVLFVQTLEFRLKAILLKTYGSVSTGLLKPTCRLLVHMGK